MDLYTHGITLEPKYTLRSIHCTDQITMGSDADDDLPGGIASDDD